MTPDTGGVSSEGAAAGCTVQVVGSGWHIESEGGVIVELEVTE